METTERNSLLPICEINNGAEFSDCGQHRYALWRVWDFNKDMIMFIGLNPSTADQQNDDPTIRRVKSLAKRWGYGGVFMLNCFSYVSTNPAALNDIGRNEINLWYLQQFGFRMKQIVFAWGNFPIVKNSGRDIELSKLFPAAKALVLNKNGSPRHPLYVPGNVELVEWPIKAKCVNCGKPTSAKNIFYCDECFQEVEIV